MKINAENCIGCIKLELRSTKVWWIPGPKFLISLTFKKFCSSCSFFVLSVHLVCFRIMLKMCHFFIFDMLYFRYPDTSTRRCMMSGIVKRQCANSIHHKDRICNNRFISIVARSKPTKRPEFVCVNLKYFFLNSKKMVKKIDGNHKRKWAEFPEVRFRGLT